MRKLGLLIATLALFIHFPAAARIEAQERVLEGFPALLALDIHAQARQCSERVGPFATQDSAWQRLRQVQSQGYGVSGVFPCYDGYGTRGYCFNVFYLC